MSISTTVVEILMHPMRNLAISVGMAVVCCTTQAQVCLKSVRWYSDIPYAFRGTDGQIQGLDIDIARTALKQMGCEVKFVEMPWARALFELEQGRLDILPGALIKPEREVFAYFSRPTNRSPNVLFMRKSSAEKYNIKQLSDLLGTNFRLGTQIDVSYGASYDTLLQNPEFQAHLTPLTMRQSGWKMIGRDRIDGLIADEISGLLELQQLGLTDVVAKTRIVVSVAPAMFAFSKKTNTMEFVTAFNAVFGAMIADGRYKMIAQRYLPCTVSAESLGCK